MLEPGAPLFKSYGRYLPFAAFASLLLSTSCFQVEDVGVAGKGGLPGAGTENIRLFSGGGPSPASGYLWGGPQGGREVDDMPGVVCAQLTLPSS